MLGKLLKVLFLFIFIFFVGGFLFTKPVSAHILKTDGSIGAVLHIDPDDDPIVGQEAHFYFDFKTKGSTFNIDNCSCTAKVLENNAEIYSQVLTSFSQDSAATQFSFTFPKKDVYQVVITGSANDSSFQNFKLFYDLRIGRGSAKTATDTSFFGKYLHFILIGAIGIIFLVIYNSSIKKKHE